MIQFILNNKAIETNQPPGMLLLDFVRYHQHLTGTKIGCREGDCGACTNLIGELQGDEVIYRSFTSCLTPLGNVHGKHVVTIEGLNMEELNPIQQAMSDCSATQCGFCTPGFVVSLSGYCLSNQAASANNVISSIDGNICRCTGYKSIEKAASKIAQLMQKKGNANAINFVTENKILPAYFTTIPDRLKLLSLKVKEETNVFETPSLIVGGGTDLYVQRHDAMKYASIHFLYDAKDLKFVKKVGDRCILGPSATVADLQESPVFQEYFPSFKKMIRLVSSTPIRNMATIAGNFINASPIGDFTIFFLALDAMVTFSNGMETREIPLRKLYKGYKQLNKSPDEYIVQIAFQLPNEHSFFNFEKVSKRTHLDIASVNTAIHLQVKDNRITAAGIAAGGVGPVPFFLEKTSLFLIGKPTDEATLRSAIEIAQSEVSPISDARGTAAYKKLLLSQLIKSHFIELFGDKMEINKILQTN